MSIAIGIDLGTTNTVVAAVVDGVAVTLEDERKRRLLPSIVAFHPSGEVIVGDAARERLFNDPENTIYSVKRLIGRSAESEEAKRAALRSPFKLTNGANRELVVSTRGGTFSIPEISAFVLRRAKAIAEAALGQKVEKAVITVPANFNDVQRAATKVAGRLAGLEVLRILNEPTAAALAYGQSIADTHRLAVYDLGGGTFDITLLDLAGSVFEVLSTRGDSALGGDDIDLLIAEMIANEVVRVHRSDPRGDSALFGRLRLIGELIKRELSTVEEVTTAIDDVGFGPGGAALSLNFRLTRADLEAAIAPLVERTIQVAQDSMKVVGLSPQLFDRVILVGGSTRIPLVARRVEELFQKPPYLRVNPDEVVALGAAIQAFSLNRTALPKKRISNSKMGAVRPTSIAPPHKPPVLRPRKPEEARGPEPLTSRSLPLEPEADDLEWNMEETLRGEREAPATPPAPAPALPSDANTIARPAARITFSPPPMPPTPYQSPDKTARLPSAPPLPAAAKLPAPPVPPDPLSWAADAIPQGAATTPDLDAFNEDSVTKTFEDIKGRIAEGTAVQARADAPLLIDVTPLDLLVETAGGYADALIQANTPVPCDRTRVFITASDNQTTVTVRVAQGVSRRFEENTLLGELELSGIRNAARGDVHIAVTFELDADGILNVKAQDKESGHATTATMKIAGINNEPSHFAEMIARQAKHTVS